MTAPQYTLSEPEGPAMGLIVLSVDETIEGEIRRAIAPQDARLYTTRVAAGADLTPASIHAMGTRLSSAAALLPQAVRYDVIGYACTSATAMLGADHVAEAITRAAPARATTDPLTAALAYSKAHRLRRISVLSPYTDAVAAPLLAAFRTGGWEIPASLSFGEDTEAKVARIDAASLTRAAETLAATAPCEAVFLSCTNLRTADILAPLSDRIGCPVFSSNAAMIWHMRRLAGLSP